MWDPMIILRVQISLLIHLLRHIFQKNWSYFCVCFDTLLNKTWITFRSSKWGIIWNGQLETTSKKWRNPNFLFIQPIEKWAHETLWKHKWLRRRRKYFWVSTNLFTFLVKKHSKYTHIDTYMHLLDETNSKVNIKNVLKINR